MLSQGTPMISHEGRNQADPVGQQQRLLPGFAAVWMGWSMRDTNADLLKLRCVSQMTALQGSAPGVPPAPVLRREPVLTEISSATCRLADPRRVSK